MLVQDDYKTHNHVNYLVNYHFVWIPKRRKKVLTGNVAKLVALPTAPGRCALTFQKAGAKRSDRRIISLARSAVAWMREIQRACAQRLASIFAELAIEKGWEILALEVAFNHVHLFVSAKPIDAAHLIVKAFKGRSSYIRAIMYSLNC